MKIKNISLYYLYFFIFIAVFLWSIINPKEYFTYTLEVFPVFITLGVLLYSYKSFKLTHFAYIVILIHCIILFIGGHYTYANVPLFDTLKDIMNFSRNNYDKVGHFAQGFTPTLLLSEIIIRKNIINNKIWQKFLIVSSALGFSAFYELIEWWTALATKENAQAFLGTQGYIWDTQSDMFFALIGSLSYLIFFKKIHKRQISKIY